MNRPAYAPHLDEAPRSTLVPRGAVLRALPVADAESRILAVVEGLLQEAVADRAHDTPGLLGEASRTLVLAPGAKRLRPRLVALLASELGVREALAVRAAAAAELMHAASLLHDDVVDEGQLRRGLPTANARWGNATAVLAGDWLLTQAFQVLAGTGDALVPIAIRAVAEMTGGAILEIESRSRIDGSFAAWRRIAEAKTGALFAWCGEAVGVLAGDPGAACALRTFGRHLGVAFQMADDLGDLRGALGKDRFSDIRSKTPSSVLVLAMEQSPVVRERLSRVWESDAVTDALANAIGSAVMESRAPQLVLALLEQELALAQAAAEPVVRGACAAELRRIGERFVEGLRGW
jgi:geranylgeranyl pyrophosphate synthase